MNPAAQYMSARGVISGIGNNLLAPERNVTRAEFITMLMRAIAVEPQGNWMVQQFSDVSADAFYSDVLLKAKVLGLVSGVGDNKFNPNAEITRQDMFVMLYRAMEKFNMTPEQYTTQFAGYSDWSKVASYATEALQNLSKLDLVNGSDGAVNPTGAATRAEAAEVIYNMLLRDVKSLHTAKAGGRKTASCSIV